MRPFHSPTTPKNRGLTGLLAAALATAPASASMPTLEADEQVYDADRRVLTASGDVELRDGPLRITTERVDIDQRGGTVSAPGAVSLTRGPMRVLARQARYDYTNEHFTARDFRLTLFPFFAEGETLDGKAERVSAEDLTIYFLEPDASSLNMQAKSAEIVDGETLKVRSATFRVGKVPFFYLPSFSQRIEDANPIEYRTSAGYRGDLGLYWQNRLLVQQSPSLRIGGNLDGYSQRGALFGPALKYDIQRDMGVAIRLASEFDSGLIIDEGDDGKLGRDNLDRDVRPKRYFVEWQTRGSVGKRADLTSSLTALRDSEVERDFRPDYFERNAFPDSFFEGAYRSDDWLVTGLLRYQPNTFIQSSRRLPEVQAFMAPVPILEAPVYQRAKLGFAHLIEKDPADDFRNLRSDRFNGYYGLLYPAKPADWLTLTPVAGAQLSHYQFSHAEPDEEQFTRAIGELGLDAEGLITGTWDVHSDIWDIDGIRHTLKPKLHYRYLPDADGGEDVIPAIDRPATFSTYLEPLSLPDRRDIDQLEPQNVLRLGAENRVQTRARSYGSRDLAELHLYQDLRFRARTPEDQVLGKPDQQREDLIGDTHTELALLPAYWLENRFYLRADAEDRAFNQISTRTTVRNTEAWSVTLGNDFIADVPRDDDVHQYAIDTRYRINQRNTLSGAWRVDATLGDLTRQTYAWQRQIGNSWLVELNLTVLRGANRESNLNIGASARLLGF